MMTKLLAPLAAIIVVGLYMISFNSNHDLIISGDKLHFSILFIKIASVATCIGSIALMYRYFMNEENGIIFSSLICVAIAATILAFHHLFGFSDNPWLWALCILLSIASIVTWLSLTARGVIN